MKRVKTLAAAEAIALELIEKKKLQGRVKLLEDLLERSEDFIGEFEGDILQEGAHDLLADIAIAFGRKRDEGRPERNINNNPTGKPYCCKIGCNRDAQYRIRNVNGHWEDISDSCHLHIGDLLPEPEHLEARSQWEIVPITEEDPS